MRQQLYKLSPRILYLIKKKNILNLLNYAIDLIIKLCYHNSNKRTEQEREEIKMLKENDMIKVHLYDTSNREIKTRNFDKIFRVYKNGGKFGIDWNIERSPYTCKGELFTPFEAFAQNVIFENVKTGERYRFSNIKNELEKIV